MLTQEEIGGTWSRIKGRIQEEWGNLTDDDLTACKGDINQLVGVIQSKSGKAKKEIEETIRNIYQESESFLSRSKGVAQDYLHQAMDGAKSQLENAEGMVKHRPAQSVLVSFGTGLLLGVIVGMVVKSK